MEAARKATDREGITDQIPAASPTSMAAKPCDVAVLTGGGDKPYVIGLTGILSASGLSIELIGSDDLDVPILKEDPNVRFLNLRGDMNPSASLGQKLWRIILYYMRLMGFAATTKTKIFHILWNNKFESFDRTILLLYYRLLGKRIVKTVHNVNRAERDGGDNGFNRWTLRCEYRLCDHLFVHTEKMKAELEKGYGVPAGKISVIPLAINDSVRTSDLCSEEARRKLSLAKGERTVLFFGNIAPYKGVEHLVEAMILLAKKRKDYRMIIAGRPKGGESYWERVQERIRAAGLEDATIERIEYVPDEDTEIYFKAADVLVLPYTHIYQSGVLFLGYNFGLPVIASDVGSLGDYIIPGKTGFVCRPEDPANLAEFLERYFLSDLYESLPETRQAIRDHALRHYSWETVGEITGKVYLSLGGRP